MPDRAPDLTRVPFLPQRLELDPSRDRLVIASDEQRRWSENPAEVERQTRLAAVVCWYGLGLIFLGRAAEMAGVSYVEMLDVVNRLGFQTLTFDEQDVATLQPSAFQVLPQPVLPQSDWSKKLRGGE